MRMEVTMALQLATIFNALATLSILIHLATRKEPTTVPGPPGPQGPAGMTGPAGECKCNTANTQEPGVTHMKIKRVSWLDEDTLGIDLEEE